jgi:hypothetical protein
MFGLISKLFAGRKKPDGKPGFRPRLEALERRDLMTGLAGLPVGGITVVNGGSLTLPPTAAGLALINGLPDTPVRATALADYQHDGYLIGFCRSFRITTTPSWTPPPPTP